MKTAEEIQKELTHRTHTNNEINNAYVRALKWVLQ